jgi:hypothetical protein
MVNNSVFKCNFYGVHVGVAAVKTLNNKESMTRYHIPSLAQFNIAMNFKNKMADCASNTPKGQTVLEFKNNLSMGARNRVGIGLSYRPARLHSWRN